MHILFVFSDCLYIINGSAIMENLDDYATDFLFAVYYYYYYFYLLLCLFKNRKENISFPLTVLVCM